MESKPQSGPVWHPEQPAGTSSLEPRDVDVCVVGAGIAGMSTAYCLAREGVRVLVLDARSVCSGQTALTTAHLATALDDRYYILKRERGGKAARLAAESHSAAIDFIEDIVSREQIDCDFVRVDGYLFAESGKSPRVIERESRAARDAGLAVEMLYRAPLEEFNTGPCLRFPRQGQLDPHRYLAGLARAVLRLGGRIVTGARVKAVRGGDLPRVKIEGGGVVRAGSVVVATNSPISRELAIHLKQVPYITYVVALTVPRGAIPQALYWDTADPYHYVRLHSRAGVDHLIVGGEDERPGETGDPDRCFQRLEKWTRTRFPCAGEVTHQWCGQVLETFDGLALIGHDPGAKHVYIATGDSGMGMTHGTIAGLMLTDLIQGRRNPWKKLYNPSRGPGEALSDFFSTGLDVASGYSDWLSLGEIDSLDDIHPGSGAIVQDGLEKLAVYRDEAGRLEACSAICQHMSAVVAWNDAAKTWDCAAHGSRYDCHGKAINGPTTSDLPSCDPPGE